MSDILHSATDAWNVLVSRGGLELDGRDAALADELSARLSVGTISQIPEGAAIPPLREVLERVNIEQLVNALFALVRPYTGMMRDLLEYFTQARVTQGPGQWKLALTSESESLEVDLEHFKEYLKLSGTRCFPLEVPVLDSGQRWRLKEVFDELGSRVPIGFRGTIQTTDSEPWLSATRAAKDDHAVEAPPWLPLPPVMSRMLGRKDGLEDAAAVLTEFASTVQAYLPNHRAISHGVWHLRGEVPDSVWDCLRDEHDMWIETMVGNFAAFEIASGAEQEMIVEKLNRLFDGVERRTGEFSVSFEDLLTYLNLPIWKRRYELYSAWVLTQFLRAMNDHVIELYSENGKLTFGFHATKFATILSLRQPATIYGERRIRASNLKSEHRKTGIQPDYTVWTEDIGFCNIAIECKHYKQPSYANFSNALDDYENNLPGARVTLCNYGPIHDLTRLQSKDGGITNRRFVFGLFHPENREAIQAFQKVIRETFGDPIGAQGAHEQQGNRRVLALDVSASMRDVLLNKAVQQEINEIACELGITHFAAVDDALRAIEKADCEQIDWLVEQSVSGSTELGAAADALRGPACEVYFLTDEEGVRTLGQRGHRVLEFMERFEELGSRQAKVVSLDA
jgi:hypothetical protein